MRLDANAAVADLDRDHLRSRIVRADGNLPLLGRELAGIAQHVPKYLLHTCRISEQSAVGCLQIEGKRDVAILDVATHNLNGVLKDFMDVSGLQLQFQFAMRDAGKIQHVVDQSRFEFNVAANHF